VTVNSDAEARREEHIPVDLAQPLVLEVRSQSGDVSVRAVDRTDVLISGDALGAGNDLAGEAGLMIDAHNNRIIVHSQPGGAGWSGFSGELDLDAVVGQIAKAFRRGGAVSTAKAGKVRASFGRHDWGDLAIEIPRASSGRVEIHTMSGDVQVEGITGELELHAASGDLRLTRTSGDHLIKTASGDLVIEGATGRLNAQTANGDVRITSAQIDRFQVQTANGDILVDAMLAGEGPFRAQTASGDVRLTLRQSPTEEPAATLTFHTVAGDAQVTPPFRKIDHRRWQAGPGDRGPQVEVTTVNGDLTAGFAVADSSFASVSVTRSHPDDLSPPVPSMPSAPGIAPTPPTAPAAPAPPAPTWPRDEVAPAMSNAGPDAAPSAEPGEAERLAVLEAVERGEIDVEEALRRLEAADPTAEYGAD
jgi:Putative adhesin